MTNRVLFDDSTDSQWEMKLKMMIKKREGCFLNPEINKYAIIFNRCTKILPKFQEYRRSSWPKVPLNCRNAKYIGLCSMLELFSERRQLHSRRDSGIHSSFVLQSETNINRIIFGRDRHNIVGLNCKKAQMIRWKRGCSMLKMCRRERDRRQHGKSRKHEAWIKTH